MNAPHILRREPYRLLFPTGILLAWAGLFHWLIFAYGSGGYHQVFHSIAMVQGFLMSFGVGFLLTALPRRTGTAPPSAFVLWTAFLAPIATTLAAWFGLFAQSQLPWLILAVVLFRFASSRFNDPAAKRRPPASFIWVPIALTMGVVGIVLMALYGILGLDQSVHECGKLLILQGVFVGLVIGIGGMLLPLIIRGDSSEDDYESSSSRRLHLLVAAALIATIAIEAFDSKQLAYLLRGLVVLVALITQCRIHHPPTKPGMQRWLVWLSAWLLPLGYLVAAAMAPNIQPGLHISLIGGFGLMALGVGVHISFAHGGRQDLVAKSPWQVPVFGLLVIAAIALRMLVNLDPAHMQQWIGASAGVFLVGTLVWASATWRLLGIKMS